MNSEEIFEIKNKINLTISYKKERNSELITEKITVNKDKILGEVIDEIIIKNNIKIKDNYYLYLKRNSYYEKELQKEKSIYDLELIDNDSIIISFLPNLSKSFEKIKIYKKKKRSIKNKKKITKYYL